MKKMALLFISMTLVAASSTRVTAQQKGTMGAIGANEAIHKFREFCVAHYLRKEDLLAKLRADTDTWTLYTVRRPSDLNGAIYLESQRGEIGYVDLPNQRPTINDPACHFSFISEKKSTHQSLVTLVSKELGLSSGRDTTSKNSKQMRWDYQNIDGTPVRIFVSSGIKANGRIVSRLSISRHRTPPPKPAGQII